MSEAKKEVRRYSCYVSDDCNENCGMEPLAQGAYVKYRDYAQLQADRDALLKALRARVDDCECYPAGDDCYACQDNKDLLKQVESH